MKTKVTEYEKCIEGIKSSSSSLKSDKLLECLLIRDDIAKLSQEDKINVAIGQRIIISDDFIKDSEIAKFIHKNKRLKAWRETFKPPSEFWWWYLEPDDSWVIHDWFWNALSLILFLITFVFFADTASRYSEVDPEIYGLIVLIIQISLMVTAISEFVKSAGQNMFENILDRINFPGSLRAEVRLGLTFLATIIAVLLWCNHSWIAVYYNDLGEYDKNTNRLKSAEMHFRRAISFNPDFAEAHYNLASLYEDLQLFDKAKTEYQLATQLGSIRAYNNLARLHILDEDYDLAKTLLLKGLDLFYSDKSNTVLDANDEQEVRYNLMKNLGWARLKQQRLDEAREKLQDAIDLQSDYISECETASKPQSGCYEKAAAHCLMAQVLDCLGYIDQAEKEWDECTTYAKKEDNPDEDKWVGLYDQRAKADEDHKLNEFITELCEIKYKDKDK